MITLPSSTCIYGTDHDVSLEEDLADVHGDNGYYLEAQRQIVIDSNLDDKATVRAYLHECLHGVASVTRWANAVGEKTEEIIVGTIEDFIMDNFHISPIMVDTAEDSGESPL